MRCNPLGGHRGTFRKKWLGPAPAPAGGREGAPPSSTRVTSPSCWLCSWPRTQGSVPGHVPGVQAAGPAPRALATSPAPSCGPSLGPLASPPPGVMAPLPAPALGEGAARRKVGHKAKSLGITALVTICSHRTNMVHRTGYKSQG